MRVKTGCCGFPVSHSKYYGEFGVVELQTTFYQLPARETAIRWREDAPSRFEFTVKAWQAITHPLSSPTWRKVKRPPERLADKYGFLKPTRQNFQAWEATLEISKLLQAKVCVIQCPPKFLYTAHNLRNMRKFLGDLDRGGLILVWEPRGNWNDKPEQVRKVCERSDLVHCVDLLRREPALVKQVGYFRLHGLGDREVNYRYKYTDSDLASLSRRVSSLASKGLEEAYVMFNNISMFDDAKRFLSDSNALSE